MTSSDLSLTKRRRTFVRLIGEIQHALNSAYAEEHEIRGLTKSQIAREIGRDRSFVTRKLTGMSNMTLESLADLAYALNRPVKVTLPSRDAAASGKNLQEPLGFHEIRQNRADEIQNLPEGLVSEIDHAA